MTALVVDDEASVRTVVCHILQIHGIKTLEAASGTEALQITKEHECELVADLVMPGMDGRQLISQLTSAAYPARFLLISGYSSTPTAFPGVAVLSKPFTSTQLMDAIGKLLREEGGGDKPSIGQLHDTMLKLRADWKRSANEMDQVLLGLPTSIPAPDGTLRIEIAGRRRAEAYKRYAEALKNYRDALRDSGNSASTPDNPDGDNEEP